MRVGLVCARDDFRAGGSLRVAENLARALPRLGVDARLYFAYGNRGHVGRRPGVSASYLGVRSSRDLLGWVRARRTIQRADLDVLHLVEPVMGLAWRNRGLAPRRVVHVHGRLSGEAPIGRWTPKVRRAWRRLDAAADHFICITEATRQSLATFVGVPNSRATVVHNGVDAEAFEQMPERDAAKALFGIDSQAPVAGVVARATLGKGTKEFLALARRLSPPWRLLWAGDGPELQRLREANGGGELAGRLAIPGQVADVRYAYAAMDAYLFLSHYEPFGIVLGEAMAAGLPVTGLKGPGEYQEPPRPLLSPEVDRLVNRSHPTEPFRDESAALEAVATRLEEWRREPATARKLGKEGARHVRNFSIDRQARETLAVYERLEGQRG